MRPFTVLVLVLAGLSFLGFGVGLWLYPGTLAKVGIVADAGGVVELRAFYGGLETGLGLFLLACAACAPWRRAGLWLVLLANAFTGLGRAAALLAGGEYQPFFGYALAWEGGFALLAAIALLAGRDRGGPPR